jgi:hypothetical protein
MMHPAGMTQQRGFQRHDQIGYGQQQQQQFDPNILAQAQAHAQAQMLQMQMMMQMQAQAQMQAQMQSMMMGGAMGMGMGMTNMQRPGMDQGMLQGPGMMGAGMMQGQGSMGMVQGQWPPTYTQQGASLATMNSGAAASQNDEDMGDEWQAGE